MATDRPSHGNIVSENDPSASGQPKNQDNGAAMTISVVACLCGHFESCDVCRTQPPSEEQLARIRAMSTQDWERVVTVPPIDTQEARRLGAALGEAHAREVDSMMAATIAEHFDLATCTRRG